MSTLQLFRPQEFSVYDPDDLAAGNGRWPRLHRDSQPSKDFASESPAAPAMRFTPAVHSDCDEPCLLPFARTQYQATLDSTGMLNRSRLLHQHRRCPHCERVTVIPISSDPALRLQAPALPVPGRGDLLGFECFRCGHAWSATGG